MTEPSSRTSTTLSSDEAAARIAELEFALATERAALASANQELADLRRQHEKLRAAYERARLDLELLRRRIFVAKAERVDTAQLELEFAAKLAELDALAAKVEVPAPEDSPEPSSGGDESRAPGGTSGPKRRPAMKGRRDVRALDLPEERIEITDPEMEALVESGAVERIGFEESAKLGWKRGGMKRVVFARAKYRRVGDLPETTDILTAPLPPQIFPRALACVSLVARIAIDKYADGLPLHRQEDRFEREGVPLDRGTMCRWLEHAGATLGATVIEAARKEAMRTAFLIATDATGVLVQPIADGKRKPCRRGHYFVQIADRDHVFFEYTPKETSAAVGEMFKGYSGHVLADAKNVFDVLFRPPRESSGSDPPDDDPPLGVCREVGCWSHARRKFYEAALAKSVVGREALARIGRLFALERKWAHVSAKKRAALRQAHARPHLEAFFAWVEVEHARVKDQRGILRSALGYAHRHKAALLRYLDDGRLPMTNNDSERELRRIAVGRHAWVFVGSDDHAQSAGHLFSMVASARLHGLDPEQYLRDVLRVLPHWPEDRYLELCAKYWSRTRARLDERELAAELGPLTVPPPLETATEEQAGAQG